MLNAVSPEGLDCVDCEDNVENCNCNDCMGGVFCQKCSDIVDVECYEVAALIRKNLEQQR